MKEPFFTFYGTFILNDGVSKHSLFQTSCEILRTSQVSISSTFFVRTLFLQLFSSYMYIEKAAETFYEKFERKMLMKLTPGVYGMRVREY